MDNPAKRPRGPTGSRELPKPSNAFEFLDAPLGHSVLPMSSGVMHFIEWFVLEVLSEENRNILHSKFVSMGSMCSGMALEDVAMHAIKTALTLSGPSRFSYQCSFKAESDANKRAFLKRHLHKGVPVFESNADVTLGADVPTCTVLTCGIVCKNVSSLSQDKKPVSDKSGSSGKSLAEMLESLSRWQFEHRPKLIVLECTQGLSQCRKCDSGLSGTQYIDEKLSKCGYVGLWRRVSADMFFLPQSRLRVYGLFLKVSDFHPNSLEARRRDLREASKIISDARIKTPESLSAVLARVPSKVVEQRVPKGKTSDEASSASDKWPEQHRMARQKLKLPPKLSSPPKDFLDQALKVMVPRAADALWIKLAQAVWERGSTWEEQCCILPVTMSVGFGGKVSIGKFPCLTPEAKYVLVQNGKLRVVSSFEYLALQGLQARELSFLNIAAEQDRLLRNLAGNAFTTNIIAIFLLAGLVVM